MQNCFEFTEASFLDVSSAKLIVEDRMYLLLGSSSLIGHPEMSYILIESGYLLFVFIMMFVSMVVKNI